MGTDKGLSRLTIKPTPQEALEELGSALEGATHDPDAFAQAQSCLDKYFRRDLKALDTIPLDLTWASPFFRAAWTACRQIPPGETRSYAWLAAAAGNPRAARAAGQAMARNPLALVIPCHRVIASNGDLRGYGAGGLEVKARLLALESAAATDERPIPRHRAPRTGWRPGFQSS
jgi:O-6-methylguanine DNA methyltransferase